MKITVGADPFALELKNAVIAHLAGKGIEVVDADAGESIPYYESAQRACRLIQSGAADKGILLCGTGMGMAIVANKFAGITAACVESVFAAKMCKAVNHANVLTLGAMILGKAMALQMVDVWLATAFTEGLEAHAAFLREAVRQVAQIDAAARVK
ncbi:MAG: RpiB/LacA/LacB family sugar-phosphate isomerase [Lentisphaeria bacterium]